MQRSGLWIHVWGEDARNWLKKNIALYYCRFRDETSQIAFWVIIGSWETLCKQVKLWSYFRIIPRHYWVLFKQFCNILTLCIVCVLGAVCTAFYKQSMMQSDVRQHCVHPTWLICSEAVRPDPFFWLWFNSQHKMKLNLLYCCSRVYVRLNDWKKEGVLWMLLTWRISAPVNVWVSLIWSRKK